MVSTDLAFEEGPFFLITSLYPRRQYVIWSTDAITAIQVYSNKARETILGSEFQTKYIGGLEDVKVTLRLSSTQIADLHREGYLRL